MKKAKVSIIVPVYKAEEYIEKCVDSIIEQTYTDWELILVDDGSPDRSGVLCDAIAKKDSRITVIHKTNGGAASARNQGLDKATGDYVCFIDSDDYVSPTLLSDYMNAPEADIVICGIRMTIRGHKTDLSPIPGRYDISDFILNAGNIANMILIGSTVNKLYRRSLLEDNRARMATDIEDVGEDHIFNWRLLRYAKSISTIGNLNYTYVENPESLTRSMERFNATEYALKRLKFMTRLYDEINRIGDRIQRKAIQQLFQSYFFYNIIRPIYLNPSKRADRIGILNRYRQLQRDIECNPGESFKGPVNKLILSSTKLRPALSDMIIRLLLCPKNTFHKVKAKIR